MKRWTLRISLCLILGVVTTVGVAWGLVWRGGEIDVGTTVKWFRTDDALGYVNYSNRPGTQMVECQSMRRSAGHPRDDLEPFDRVVPSWARRELRSRLPAYRAREAFFAHGWPMLALRTTLTAIDSHPEGRWEPDGDGIPTGLTWPTYAVSPPFDRALPLRPILPGFIINALFYAAIWFGVFFGVGALRRFVRRKRGRCVKCSYDLRTQFDKGCPECGWNREDSNVQQ